MTGLCVCVLESSVFWLRAAGYYVCVLAAVEVFPILVMVITSRRVKYGGNHYYIYLSICARIL